MEKFYEDKSIDAFDTPEPNVPAHSKSPVTLSQVRDMNVGPPMRPNVTSTLHPQYGDKPIEAALVPMSMVTQHSKEIEADEMQQCPVRLNREELMSEEDLETHRQQIKRDVRVYQQQVDRVAQALARETPHQIQERKKRKEKRLERQEQRHEAIKTRMQRDVERLEEREERRFRLQTRNHHERESQSPSSDIESRKDLRRGN